MHGFPGWFGWLLDHWYLVPAAVALAVVLLAVAVVKRMKNR